jgi:hypothetical protein
MAATRFWTVDHVGKTDVVLVDDEGRATTLAQARLPSGIVKLTVLAVEIDAAGTPDWATATIDEAETERRRRKSEDIGSKLRFSDPKGFIYMPEE